MTIVSSLFSQNYIGAFEVYESNGIVYHETGTNDVRVDTEHIILKYQQKLSDNQIETFEMTNGLVREVKYNGYSVYRLPANITFINFCQNLEQNEAVSYIELSLFFNLYSDAFYPNDYDAIDHYHLDLLNVPEAWMLTTGNENVTVAILDSGLDYDDDEFGPKDTQVSNLFHNDLENDPWSDWDDPSSGNGLNDDGNGYIFYNNFTEYIDDWQGLDLRATEYDLINGNITFVSEGVDNDVRPSYPEYPAPYGYFEDPQHGNWMASIIAAKTNNDHYQVGIAGGNTALGKSGVKILPIKLYDWRYNSWNHEWNAYGPNTVNVTMAIRYAIEMEVDVINMSFGCSSGGSYQTYLNSALDIAIANEIVLVAAAGNENDEFISYPARNYRIIAVGATDEGDEYWDDMPDWGSNEGAQLELMAPGVSISTFDEYYLDGTSFSAAMVSATAALMKSVNPSLTTDQIRQILRETTYQNSDYNFDDIDHDFEDETRGWNEHFGFGRINTRDAVCAALSLLPENTITTNENWDEATYSKQDIIIESGGKMTLTETLRMDPSAKIVVKPGGQLIVDGGTITNMPYCSGDNLKWQGIEVWGDLDESQQGVNGVYQQGYIELKNDATIENAQTAILLGKSGQWPTLGGGIVKAYNSHFINNAKSVHFAPFANEVTIGIYEFEADNEAYFRNCDFIINSDYFDDSQFYKHADIVQVRGIAFRGCDFKRESNANTSAYCAGIQSFSAGVSVNSYSTDRCNFEGLYKGIDIHNNSSSIWYDSYISNSTFTNNSYGIDLNTITNLVSIKDNIFHVGYNSPDKTVCLSSQAYGIFLDNSNTFVIQDNEFYKYSGAPSIGDYIGIEALNTQTATDEIFRNTFVGLTHANHATNVNWDFDNIDRYKGLAYYCNIQNTNINDLFFVYDDLLIKPNSGVQIGQGNDTRTAGNTFTQNVSGYNIYNNCGHGIGYYYDLNEPLEIPTVYNSGPAFVTTHPQTLDADCSGTGIDPKSLTAPEKQNLESDYLSAESDYTSVKSLYESLEDGGSTESLKTEVETSWPNDMWELRAELLNLSPYLTTEVLITAADKTEVLPESVLFEILSANPDELKKSELMDYLENKEQPLPDYMISLLSQLAGGQTAKTAMQGDLSTYHREKSRSAHQMLLSLALEEEFDYNEYRLWLDRLGGINSDRKIIASFISEENYSDALALANLIPDLYALQENDLTEHNYYMDMLNLDITLQQENRNPMDLSSSEFELLQQIAENSKEIAGVEARGILEHFYNIHSCNCINTTVNEDKSSSFNFDQNDYAEAMGLKLTTEPNPARTWVAFNYELPIGSEKAQLIIRNTEGKVVGEFQLSGNMSQKVWNTSNLKAGTYIFELISGEIKQTGKIVIVK